MEEEKTGTRSSCPLALVTEDEEEGGKKGGVRGKKSCTPVAGVIVQSLFSDALIPPSPPHHASLAAVFSDCVLHLRGRAPAADRDRCRRCGYSANYVDTTAGFSDGGALLR